MTGGIFLSHAQIYAQVIKHPLCSSRACAYLKKLTGEQLNQQLERIYNKFQKLALAWSELSADAKNQISEIFENEGTSRETKTAILTELTRLSAEPDSKLRRQELDRMEGNIFLNYYSSLSPSLSSCSSISLR